MCVCMCVSYVAGSYHTTFSHGVTRDDNVLYPAITTTPRVRRMYSYTIYLVTTTMYNIE